MGKRRGRDGTVGNGEEGGIRMWGKGERVWGKGERVWEKGKERGMVMGNGERRNETVGTGEREG